MKRALLPGMYSLVWASLLMLLMVAGLLRYARSQDTRSPKSAQPAAEPKPILEVSQSSFAVWRTPQWTEPRPLLRVFSDRTAEVPHENDIQKVTLTPEQFEKFQFFLDQSDLLAQKRTGCGYGGYDYVSKLTITLHHREREQVLNLNNFYPRNGYTSWPGACPRIFVQLQCTIEDLIGQPDDKTTHWHEDCAEILAK